jgi:serine/threonine-protein kinase
MFCPSCHAENPDASEACFTCGRALYALTQGVVLNQRYEVLSPLGSGGMGRVYKAYDRVLDEHVAIKVLRSELIREPEAARRFRSEIKIARRVSHRNVCRIHEYGVDGGLAYISMEFIDGKNLRQFLAERALADQEALELSIQVAEGLQAVHDHGIVHRDFKASNIMIDRQGTAKLMDFGIAKHSGESSSLTGSGVVGTPEYMSPEQASGASVDLRSDVYSLGCVVYETFTGAPPFHGATPLETMRLHELEPPPLDSRAIPEPVRAILRRALAKNPAQRVGSSAELADALRQARVQLGFTGTALPLDLDAAPPGTPLPGPPTRTIVDSGPASGEPRPAAALPLLAVLVLTLGAIAFRTWSPREAPQPAPLATPTHEAASRPPPSREPSASPSEAAPGSPAPPAEPSAEPPPDPATSPSPTPITGTAPSAVAPAEPGEQASLGTLALLIVPESEVQIDGWSIGAVSDREVGLPAGTHAVLVLHPDYKPLPRKVTIVPGTVTRLVLDLKEKAVRRLP